MSLTTRLKGIAINAYLSDPARRARAYADQLERRIRRQPARAELYIQIDDPYSYLLAQLAARLRERYPVEWEVYLVPPAPKDADPEPDMRRRHALRDARELARYYDLRFPEARKPPEGTPVQRAAAVLARQRPAAEQLEAAQEVADALFRGDAKALATARGRFQFEGTGNVAPISHVNYQRLRQRGHYLGGTIRYGGEWFAGVDRVAYLEARLRRDFDRPDEPSVLRPRPAAELPAERLPVDEDGAIALEVWFSFRSPYSYLALAQLPRLAARHRLRLIFRPVLPMVARGLALPREKRLYLATDAKREADRLGIPFGRLCDPLGAGVERCLAIFHATNAASPERALAFAQSAMRGIWSEALDLADDHDLGLAVERAGLRWSDAHAALADAGWRSTVADNALALNKLDLWGVPSFRIGDYATWGQDRLPLIERKLEGHVRALESEGAAAPSSGG